MSECVECASNIWLRTRHALARAELTRTHTHTHTHTQMRSHAHATPQTSLTGANARKVMHVSRTLRKKEEQ